FLTAHPDAILVDITGTQGSTPREANAPDGIVCSAGSAAIAVNAGIEAAGKALGRDLDMVSKQSVPLLNWIRHEIIT
ncbi:LacI family transcriptional regulator, partial [Rhizobium leguminosarum]